MNTANALYGMFGASVLALALVSLLIFLFIWNFSRYVLARRHRRCPTLAL